WVARTLAPPRGTIAVETATYTADVAVALSYHSWCRRSPHPVEGPRLLSTEGSIRLRDPRNRSVDSVGLSMPPPSSPRIILGQHGWGGGGEVAERPIRNSLILQPGLGLCCSLLIRPVWPGRCGWRSGRGPRRRRCPGAPSVGRGGSRPSWR